MEIDITLYAIRLRNIKEVHKLFVVHREGLEPPTIRL